MSARPRRGTLADLRNRKFRTRVDISNALAVVPAGTRVRVIGKHNGVTIETARCKTCQVGVRIRRVPLADLEEIRPS